VTGTHSVVVAPVLVLAGLGTGVASLARHGTWWGLGLVAAATLATLLALPRGWATRPAFALGWLVPVLVVGLQAGPGGDVVVVADLRGYLLLALALVVAVVVLLTLPPGRRGAPDESGSGPVSA